VPRPFDGAIFDANVFDVEVEVPKPQFWTPIGEIHMRNPHGVNAPGWGRRFLHRVRTRRFPWSRP
jgi:hypothetical protein